MTDWTTLWSVARYDLGLSAEEFWRLTPVEFNALLRRRSEGQNRDDYMVAVLCTLYANVNRDPKRSQPYELSDFLPGLRAGKRQQSDEQLKQIARSLCLAFGGKVVSRAEYERIKAERRAKRVKADA